ncbi:MAG: aspartate/glutamate racemase family protein, partial [Tissierellales bacterium]
MDNRPIGVFDSGIGGLTVLKEISEQLPGEDVVYFGDTARIPYGSRSKETVIRYFLQSARFLLTKNIKAIVIACNTASAMAMEEAQKEFDIPIIGVIEP